MYGDSLAIVAIPSEDDYIWKISSEKVPHLTLCFLGDQSKNPNLGLIESFLGHAAKTMLRRFGLGVDRRGSLGPEQADVLFFEKQSYTVKTLEDFRSALLQDQNIFEAYNSTFQYPEWTPHLTLGFPDTPAKPDTRDYPGTTWVTFDRIALWTGDYEGPEFQLDRYDGVAEMSDKVEEFLEHFGVKGMKWGVRRDQGHEGESAKTSKIARLDKKFEKRASSLGLQIKVYNTAVKRYNTEDLDKINNKAQYKGQDFLKDTPLRRRYYKEHRDAFLKQFESAASELGTNASGTKKYTTRQFDDGTFDIVTTDVKHEDASVRVRMNFDESGYVTSLEVLNDSMMSGARDIVDVLMQSDELAHFGVKGMKWGVRRKRSSEHDSEDAKNAEEAARKVKKHGARSLTNKELQQLVTRMNLEQQLSNLQDKQPSKFRKGKKVAQDLISAGQMANQAFQLVNSPAAKAARSSLGL